MPLFVRITLAVALAIMAFIVVLFVIKVLIFAAVVATLVLGGLFVAGAVRRRIDARRGTIMTITPRR